MRIPYRALALASAGAGLLFTAAPAFAQAYSTIDEVVVTGHLGPDGRPQRLSRAIDITDLDLRYDRDVREAQRRVRTTARQLCDELGERDTPSVGESCVNNAVRNTDRQVRYAIAQARSPTYYAYVAPAPAYAGEYAPPASAVVPVYPDDYPPPPPPEF